MTAYQTTLDPAAEGNSAATPLRKSEIPDDKAMLRAAAELTRDISTARPDIYWPDMIISALVGYAALAGAILLQPLWLALLSGFVSFVALYRALLFIHEITHLHRNALPGFRTTWNLLVGIPLLTPSLMYEQVHTIHHSRMRYGTPEDPEYLPLALMKPWSLPLFLLVALLAPVGLLLRWGVIAPIGLVIPPVRKWAWERVSSLSINPAFRRREPETEEQRRWFRWQQVGSSIWAMFLLTTPFWLGWKPLLVAMAVTAFVAFFNQLRTMVAHLWENDGERMSVTAQYLDSVNVPSIVAGFWAPVGLRYHATHHLLPSLPYHSLHEAHCRISAHLGVESTYQGAIHKGMLPLVMKISRSTMGRRD
ncbi:fatty acid desaturase family protein [Alteraurantiacibacter aquimixticola]|uniref:Fatty acid desaturase n=1 Tax=Alteraurantiacibacter aquimixticola TaxID=2489173 RepID=A0A4T3F1T4_9SPHN|nr:fatty acid desaturase [Alteraurantiacibacter aquimixticola]TIX51175.1 fatty acid desaturase [Alteraurantiacibacter aquimixticola]